MEKIHKTIEKYILTNKLSQKHNLLSEGKTMQEVEHNSMTYHHQNSFWIYKARLSNFPLL